MSTPEVTGSAALQSEEIKKIAREYAEYCCPESSYDGDIVERNMDLRICADEALPTLEWLSNDYCIVPKEEIKGDYDFNARVAAQLAKGVGERCSQMREWHQGKCDELISLFGKELFEEEQK